MAPWLAGDLNQKFEVAVAPMSSFDEVRLRTIDVTASVLDI
jgi:hypothetical protein